MNPKTVIIEIVFKKMFISFRNQKANRVVGRKTVYLQTKIIVDRRNKCHYSKILYIDSKKKL